jgi:CHASE3 domain sensor protein
MLIFSGLSSLVAYQKAYFQAAAQTMTSPDLAKVLVDSAIQALQNGSADKTILHLKAAEQELVLLAENSNPNNNCPSLQSQSTILVVNAIIS